MKPAATVAVAASLAVVAAAIIIPSYPPCPATPFASREILHDRDRDSDDDNHNHKDDNGGGGDDDRLSQCCSEIIWSYRAMSYMCELGTVQPKSWCETMANVTYSHDRILCQYPDMLVWWGLANVDAELPRRPTILV